MGTNIYVDGFNLYYCALRKTPYRWLDLPRLCHLLLPRDDIIRIKYFTAAIPTDPLNPSRAARQQTYFRALRTIPNLEIHLGHFLSHPVRMPLADGSGFADVIRTEEKATDVALATYMTHDAHVDEYGTAVILSNDSDLVPPVCIVRELLGKPVGMLCPGRHPSRHLLHVVDFVKRIRPAVLAASQFPDVLTDTHGTFHKPESW